MGLLFALICLGIGVVWYANLQPQIPKELNFLKFGTHSATVVSSTSSAQSSTQTTKTGWTVVSNPEVLQFSRDFSDSIKAGSMVYDSPSLTFTCYRNNFYISMDTRLQARGSKAVEVTVDGHTQPWTRGEGQNIYATRPAEVLKILKGHERATFSLDFYEAPRQPLTVELKGLDKVIPLMQKNCLVPD